MDFYLIKIYGSYNSLINKFITDEIPKVKELNKFRFKRINIEVITSVFLKRNFLIIK